MEHVYGRTRRAYQPGLFLSRLILVFQSLLVQICGWRDRLAVGISYCIHCDITAGVQSNRVFATISSNLRFPPYMLGVVLMRVRTTFYDQLSDTNSTGARFLRPVVNNNQRQKTFSWTTKFSQSVNDRDWHSSNEPFQYDGEDVEDGESCIFMDIFQTRQGLSQVFMDVKSAHFFDLLDWKMKRGYTMPPKHISHLVLAIQS